MTAKLTKSTTVTKHKVSKPKAPPVIVNKNPWSKKNINLENQSEYGFDAHVEGKSIPLLITNDGVSKLVPVELIDPNPWQPRKEFQQEKIEQLAVSIDLNGLIEPVVLRVHGDRYQLIVGERRWRAHILLKKPNINAIVKPVDDMQMALMAVAENLDREDLSDYEVALAINSIENQFGSRAELARYLDKTRVELYRYLAFIELPQWLKDILNEKPTLINRTAAEDLKRLFGKNSELSEKYYHATLEVIQLIESENIAQIYVASKIEEIANIESESLNIDTPEKNIKDPKVIKSRLSTQPILLLNRAGKFVGKINNNGKKITLTLSCAAINSEQEIILQDFVNNLINPCDDEL